GGDSKFIIIISYYNVIMPLLDQEVILKWNGDDDYEKRRLQGGLVDGSGSDNYLFYWFAGPCAGFSGEL
ncbi:hypothetical protein JXL19_08655, partial [bacterium]|nr:hypothetical protein [bacterium]